MIRVLHSVSNMDRAGIETMVMNFYRHMDREQVQFDFLCNKKKPGAYEPEIAKMGGRVYRSPGFHPAKFPAYVACMRKILQESPDTRIVHVHNGALGLYALVAAKRAGMRKRCYHAHGSKLLKGKGRVLKTFCRPLIDFFAVYKLACGLKAAKFYYHRATIRRREYMLFHNAIDIERFAYNAEVRAQMRDENELSGHAVLGHIGRFAPEKNHARLLRVFKAFRTLVPDAVLLLIGEGDLRGAIENQAKALCIDDAVRIHEPVDCPEKWYQAMDAFVLPSFCEGLPVVSIEAQTAGLPCVMSSSVTEETAVTGLARFVSLSESDEKWARSIKEAIDNAKERLDTRAEIAAAGYDIALEAKRLQDFYIKIANEE